jgi:hypothetical protein
VVAERGSLHRSLTAREAKTVTQLKNRHQLEKRAKFKMNDSTRIEKLTERTNFEVWKFAIRRHIGGKGQLKVLDKTYTIPSDPVKREELENHEQRTQGILASALNEHHMAAVIHCNSSNGMWKIILGMREIPRRQDLLSENKIIDTMKVSR